MRRLIFLLLLLLPWPAHAEGLRYEGFARLPVQHEGRTKPVDTFGRVLLERFSGQASTGTLGADAWLAEALFDPGAALHRPVFRLFRPGILDLPLRERGLYSYAELAPALQAKADIIETLGAGDEKDWSDDQRELMRLSENVLLYSQLLRSFSYVMPLPAALPGALAKEWGLEGRSALTLEDYRPHAPRITAKLQEILRAKGEDPANYTDAERAVAQLAMELQVMESAGAGNVLLRIVPGANGEEWFSPWQVQQEGKGSPAGVAVLDQWQALARAYRAQDEAAWDAALAQLQAARPSYRITLEVWYNKARPLLFAGGAYLAAFLAALAYGVQRREGLRRLSLALLGAGGFAHMAAVAARVVILERPPVGTLYESILFVAMVCVLIACGFERLRGNGQGVLMGALCGLVLLFVAGSLAEGDTMTMLVAVLNTNFWLSTHVLCITMGYGWCVMASLLAHGWLVQKARGRDAGDLLLPIKIVTLVALFFTALGTILGGIWADQSWGRFWGWDPKENGALLIVLWLIWLLHGQIGGHLNRATAMACTAALSIIVALAWFGVNLLSVGLHSYGFVSGVAAGLGAFCALEAALIGFLWHRGARR